MTNEMLSVIKNKAEAFPVLLIVEETMVDDQGNETSLPYEDFMLQKINEDGAEYLGKTEASFTLSEAMFIAEARGDILALVEEVEYLKRMLARSHDAISTMIHSAGQYVTLVEDVQNVLEER